MEDQPVLGINQFSKMKMKYLFIALMSVVCTRVISQNSNLKAKPIIRSERIYTNGKLSFYLEKDINGNTVFSKNDGMNGPITMLSAEEYDSLNRETLAFFVHSNLGFSLRETVYMPDRIIKYDYSANTETVNSYDRDSLNKINTREEFLQLDAVRNLLKGEKHIKEIDMLDSSKNIISIYYISEKGDTTTINTYRYNSKGKPVFFHYGKINSEEWTWDIFYTYDNNLHPVKSYRISTVHGTKDTSEVYNYIYNSSGLLVSKNYYFRRQFKNRTDYTYLKEQVAEEHFYEGDESVMKALISYKYDKNGNRVKKTTIDFRKPKKDRKEINTYKYTYW